MLLVTTIWQFCGYYIYNSNLDVVIIESIPGLRKCHLGYSQAPERRASFVNIFQHRNNAFNVYNVNNSNNLGMDLGIRRKSEINPVSIRDPILIRGSNDRLPTTLPVKPPSLMASRRTSLQIPHLGISCEFKDISCVTVWEFTKVLKSNL